MKIILILAYYSIKDPVFQSAVLPYFTNFPDDNFKFILLTYEHQQFHLTASELENLKGTLNNQGIVWLQLKWHSGNLKWFKKIYDFVVSIFSIMRIVKAYNINAIYSEGFPGAIIGYFASILTHKFHYIHTFEPHADYMLEAKVWKSKSWEYILLKSLEKKIALQAKMIFTATNGMIKVIESWGVKKTNLYKVPSCIDLNKFRFNESQRDAMRKRWSVSKNDVVIVYLGKMGGMYMEEEIFEMYRILQKSSVSFKYLFLTQESKEKILYWFDNKNIPKSNVIICKVEHNQVPNYLSAADFGFVAVRQKQSKKYCSPIKTGEYLACGLPVIVPRGISDDYKDIETKKIGVVLNSTSIEDYKLLNTEIIRFLADNSPKKVRKKAREYVKQQRDVDIYKKLYAKLF